MTMESIMKNPSMGMYSFNNDIHGSPALSNSQSLDLFVSSQPQGPENYPIMQSQLVKGQFAFADAAI